jgi:two-component sensor histidine kinase
MLQQPFSKNTKSRRPGRLLPAGILIAAVIIIPVVLLAIAAWRDYQSVKQQVQAEVSSGRDLLRQHALSIFLTHDVIAHSIMSRIRGMSWDEIQSSRTIHEYLTEIAQQFPQVHSVWLNDAEGNARSSSVMFPVPAINVSDREYYKVLKSTSQRTVVTKPFRPRQGPQTEVFNVSFRIDAPDGSFGGFVGTAISTDYFREVFRSLNTAGEPEGSSSLFREDGAILVRDPPLPGKDVSYASDPELMKMFHSTDRGTFERNSTTDGIWRSYAFARVDGFPVYVGRGVSQNTITTRWERNLVSYFAFFASSLAVLLALGYLSWRQNRMLRANAENLEALVVERTRHLNRALDEKTAFFREVHHRVKNNLQIISSLARLQESHGEEPGQLERRIQAMALVHELLYSRAEATNLNLSEYVPKLCSALEAAGDRRTACKVNTAAVAIDLERAIPFALILSEAVTNAFKHARTKETPLEVSVDLGRDGDDLVLEVRDNGADSLTPTPDGKGFGLKLIRALTTQLEGQSEFHVGGGTRFTLRFPFEKAQRDSTA